mgnify:CR=1 FL=1
MKLALLHAELSSSSRLESLQISQLIEGYQSLNHPSQTFSLAPDVDYLNIRKICSSLVDQKVDRIIFLTKSAATFKIIEQMSLIGFTGSFVFHLDGQFIFDAKEWGHLAKINCHFVCRSKRSLELVKSFLKNKKQASLLGPVTEVVSLEKDNQKIREKLKIANDELVFLFVGNISRQQHVIELTSLMLKFCAQISPKVNLWLCGQFKDEGIPLVGKTELEFEHYQSWLKLCHDSPHGHKIAYLGDLDLPELQEVYAQADWGMFVGSDPAQDLDAHALEALSHGLPCVLSNWGGHSDLMHEKYVRSLAVEVKGFHLSPDLKRLTKDLFLMLNQNVRPDDATRAACSKYYQDKFGTSFSPKVLEQILSQCDPFSGFNQQMITLAAAFERNPYAPFVDVTSYGGYNQEFEEIYASYFGDS